MDPVDGTGDLVDPVQVRDAARPILMWHFRAARDSELPGRYDAKRQMRLNEDGKPVVSEPGPLTDTFTEVRTEPADPIEPPRWFTETATKVRSEDPDDFGRMTDTESRTREDPADPDAPAGSVLRGDDSVTGVVAF